MFDYNDKYVFLEGQGGRLEAWDAGTGQKLKETKMLSFKGPSCIQVIGERHVALVCESRAFIVLGQGILEKIWNLHS